MNKKTIKDGLMCGMLPMHREDCALSFCVISPPDDRKTLFTIEAVGAAVLLIHLQTQRWVALLNVVHQGLGDTVAVKGLGNK